MFNIHKGPIFDGIYVFWTRCEIPIRINACVISFLLHSPVHSNV